MAHNFVTHLEIGSNFEDIYFLESFSEKVAKNGKVYTDLTLRDSSGSSPARYWGKLENVETGKFIACKVSVESYNEKPQIIIKECGTIDNPTDLSDYVSVSATLEKDKETFQKILKNISEMGDKIQNKFFISILETIFTDKFLTNFNDAPSGVLPFYGKRGGLLAQTIKIATIVNDISKTYQIPMLERSLLLTAALLQGIGGVEACVIENLIPKETRAGVLIGKLNLSLNMLNNKVPATIIDDDSSGLYLRLRHMISVSGYSAQKPVTKEAVIFSEACRADYNIVEALDFIQQDTNKGDFTAFDSVGKRRYFKG